MPDGGSTEMGVRATRSFSVGFFYNHEAGHQVAHSAPIAAQLALLAPGARITVLATSQALLDRARACCGPSPAITFELLETPPWQRSVARLLDPVAPFGRVANLVRHRERLARFDILVVPERTSLLLRHLLGPRTPLLVHTKHGSGDRAQGYSPVVGRFDLVLLSGAKLHERLVGAGLLAPERAAIVGYPKFDTIEPSLPRPRLFKNNRPTVVYNPHPMPGLSSWYDMGIDVLDYFANQDRYNLIFAPHIMLFRRRMHFSTETFKVRLRRELPARLLNHPNILVDTGSARLLDMTYLRAADIYIGDVSSQIYEFLLTPRPMIFLNPGQLAWQGNANFDNWSFGPVVSDIAGLERALRELEVQPDRYRVVQDRGFRRTFDLDRRPSSQRAAQAILALARRNLLAGETHTVDAHGGRVDAVNELKVGGGG